MATGIYNYGTGADTLANPSLSSWASYTASTVAGVRIYTGTGETLPNGNSLTDHLIICNNTSVDITMTLPSVTSVTGRELVFKNISTKKVTIARNGSDTIDGSAAAFILGGIGYVALVSDGISNWTVTNAIRNDITGGHNSASTWSHSAQAWLLSYSDYQFVTTAMLKPNLTLDTPTLTTAVLSGEMSGNLTASIGTTTFSSVLMHTTASITGNLTASNGNTTLGVTRLRNNATFDTTASITGNLTASNGVTLLGTTNIIGTVTASSIKTSVAAKTAVYSITNSDSIVTCNGTFDVTLPTAVGITGQQFIIRNIATTTITIKRTSSQTIDSAAADVVLAGKGTITIVSDGANWLVLNGQYTDESIGRRLFTWSSALAGWQTTYSDTGSRNMSAVSLLNSWTVDASQFYITRKNNTVNLVLSANGTAATGATASIIYALPSGFRPSSSIIFTPANDNASVAVRSNGNIDMRTFSASIYRISMLWDTADAWPASLPGTANGSIAT